MATALKRPQPTLAAVPEDREDASRFELHDLLVACRRRWKLIVVPAIVAPLLAAVLASLLPKHYRSETRLLVQRDTVLNPLVGPPTAAALAADDRLAQFDKLIRNRASLLGTAEELGFLPQDPLAQEELATDMDARLETFALGGDAFLVAYTDQDPVRAKNVCETLSARFVDRMVEDQIRDARQAVEHLAKRVDEQKEHALQQRSALEGFERENQAALPEQQGAVLARMQRLERELQDTEIQLALIPEQFAQLEELLTTTELMILDQERVDHDRHPKVDEMYALQTELTKLLRRAKETHPDVVLLRQQIADLDAEIREEYESRPGPEDRNSSPYRTRQRVYRRNQAYTELEAKRLDLQLRRDQLELQAKGLEQSLQPLREEVGRFAEVKADYERLRSQSDMAANQRDKLIAQHASAVEQLQLERAQERTRFRVIEPARVPVRHFKPSRTRIAIAGGFVGIILGLLLAFFSELTDPFLRKRRDLEGVLQGRLPVLTRLPRIEPRR